MIELVVTLSRQSHTPHRYAMCRVKLGGFTLHSHPVFLVGLVLGPHPHMHKLYGLKVKGDRERRQEAVSGRERY